jgi:hypothetical protein
MLKIPLEQSGGIFVYRTIITYQPQSRLHGNVDPAEFFRRLLSLL